MAQRTVEELRDGMAEREPLERHYDYNYRGWGLQHGAIGGAIAGLVFAMFEMVMALVMNGPGAFFMPLRMIGAIVLGSQALEPTYPLLTAALAGVMLHMMLSVIYGLAFAAVIRALPRLAESAGALVGAASLYGLALWLVNFYAIAPAFGWNWFPEQTNPVVQFVAHTFFFGTALGLYLQQIAGRRRPVRA